MSHEFDLMPEVQSPSAGVGRLWRRWLFATLIGVLAAGIGFVLVAVFSPKEYSASAWLQISQERPYVVYPSPDDFGRYARTQVQLLLSPVILEKVAENQAIAPYPEIQGTPDSISWLARNLSVVQADDSELFVVTFKGADPKRAADIVNEVVNVYLRRLAQDESQRMNEVLALLDQEATRRANRMAALRESVKILIGQLGGTIDLEIVALTHRELEKEILSVNVEARMLEAEIEAWRDSAQTANRGAQDALSRPDQSTLGTNAAALPGHRDELDELQKKLALVRVKENTLRNEHDSRMKRFTRMSSHLEKHQLEIQFRRSELAREEKVFDEISRRALQLRTESNAPLRVQPVAAATPPRAPLPLRERITRLSPLGVMAAFLCGLVVSFVTGIWAGYVRPRPARSATPGE